MIYIMLQPPHPAPGTTFTMQLGSTWLRFKFSTEFSIFCHARGQNKWLLLSLYISCVLGISFCCRGAWGVRCALSLFMGILKLLYRFFFSDGSCMPCKGSFITDSGTWTTRNPLHTRACLLFSYLVAMLIFSGFMFVAMILGTFVVCHQSLCLR